MQLSQLKVNKVCSLNFNPLNNLAEILTSQRQNTVPSWRAAKLMWAELMISSDKRVNYLMVSTVPQNGPKTMFFKDYSLYAYLRSKCTTPDIYTCYGVGLVVIPVVAALITKKVLCIGRTTSFESLKEIG